MPTYIYLNTYANGYMYVGSHTWGGAIGTLDSNYHGSSRIAERYNWVPVKEEILCTPSDEEKYEKESFYINMYASLYGLSKLVTQVNGISEWTKQFRNDGLLLNCHANNAAHLFTEENRTKTLQARLEKGYKTSAIKSANTKRLKGTAGAVLHRYRATLGDISKEFDRLIDACTWCELLLRTKFVRVTISQLLTQQGEVIYKGVSFSYINGTPKRPHKILRDTIEKIRESHIKTGQYKKFSEAGRRSLTKEIRSNACKNRSLNPEWVKRCKEWSNKGNSPEGRAKSNRTRLLHSQLYKEVTTGLVGPISKLRTISPTLEYKASSHFKVNEYPLVWADYKVIKIDKSENYKFI